MSEGRELKLKFVKGVGKRGNIGVRVYTDDPELLNQLWGRLADFWYGGVQVRDKWLFKGSSQDPEAWGWLYATLDEYGDMTADVEPEDVEALTELLKAELEEITTPWEYEVVIRPKRGNEE